MIHPTQGAPTQLSKSESTCIKVTKVFDWVLTSSIERIITDIPDACPTLLQTTDFQVFCCPLPETHQITISTINRNISGLPSGAACVNFACTFLTKISFFCKDNLECPICCIEGPISFWVNNFILCLPEPLNEENIICNVISCEANGFVINDELYLDITVYLDVQVEDEVKLKLDATFCNPRTPIACPTNDLCVPPQSFRDNALPSFGNCYSSMCIVDS